MSEWKKLSSRQDKVGYKTATIKKFEMPDGKIEEYTTWNKPNTQCIATIALTWDNKIIVAHQFRPGPEIMMDELPGGGANEGEVFGRGSPKGTSRGNWLRDDRTIYASWGWIERCLY